MFDLNYKKHLSKTGPFLLHAVSEKCLEYLVLAECCARRSCSGRGEALTPACGNPRLAGGWNIVSRAATTTMAKHSCEKHLKVSTVSLYPLHEGVKETKREKAWHDVDSYGRNF